MLAALRFHLLTIERFNDLTFPERHVPDHL
jgi:hypothetical protein